ncbi:hypothetical protein CK203_052905 [Vitis vinifera]|uniref:Uncharacterized protein n=1 Tax=Vitis vinifera TaxID=29760 RepID=A0A438H7X8_VITVI|nr:hypothetical protein CK203_052905 [Vitis vinifera]
MSLFLLSSPDGDSKIIGQALFDVNDGISKGLWSDITPSLDTKEKRVVGSFESYGGSVQQYPSMHHHAATVRPLFKFQRPHTSIPRDEQSCPRQRYQMAYSDLGMPLDRAFE